MRGLQDAVVLARHLLEHLAADCELVRNDHGIRLARALMHDVVELLESST